MGTKIDIDGTRFKKSLLKYIEDVPPYRQKKKNDIFLKRLKTMCEDNDLIEDWNILLSWRSLKLPAYIVRHFRAHCLIRNEQFAKKEVEFDVKDDHMGFRKYVIDKCHIEWSHFLLHRYGTHEVSPWRLNDWHPLLSNRDTSFVEEFTEDSETSGSEISSWGLLDRDKKRDSPVIRLRIDPTQYDQSALLRMDKYIKAKMQKLQLKAHDKRRLNFTSWEMAIMIFDLYKYSELSNPEIDHLLFKSGVEDAEQYRRDKLQLAKSLIKSAPEKTFPVFPK